jgi:hypothetical protein
LLLAQAGCLDGLGGVNTIVRPYVLDFDVEASGKGFEISLGT